MQHPVGYEIVENGRFVLNNFWSLFSNPWLIAVLFAQSGGLYGDFSLCDGGRGRTFSCCMDKHVAFGKLFVRTGVVAGLVASLFVAFPSGDWAAKNMVKYQPVSFAAMEGLFHTEDGAEIVLIGQPDMEAEKLDNKLAVPNVLSFLTYNRWDAEVKGLNEFPKDTWPTNVPGLYYSYHIMVGLGTHLHRLDGLGGLYGSGERSFSRRVGSCGR
jgi:cytochrome d ubiquinol oxidase subunit I